MTGTRRPKGPAVDTLPAGPFPCVGVGGYHGPMTATDYGSAWCATCRTRQPIIDQYLTDTGDGARTFREFLAQPLECGHDANDGGAPPPPFRTRVDAGLVDRLVALQAAAHAGRIA